ncbi:DNA-processing protein DprA [Candidatus Margulisiibacteriota bacterium]
MALSCIREIGSVRFTRLYEKYGAIEKVYNFKAEDLRSLRLAEEKIRDIVKQRDRLQPEQELSKVLAAGIKPITIFADEYPEQLKHIYAPPYILYTVGKVELLKKKNWLAIVGTRQPSFYGMKMTTLFSQELVKNGWGIVSGMAKGIDAKAHETALINEGKTIAVLGCGIDVIYPYENKHLYKEIREKGLILSEMPLGTEPQAFQFPLRNRIITGLAKGTLVIEGDYKSGAMISGKTALDQDREVFALPGRATDVASNGPNWLIKQGAKPATDIQDILEEFGVKNAVKKTVKNEVIKYFSKEENIVFQELVEEDSKNIEVLSEKTGLEFTTLLMILSGLELKGYIKQLPGKLFIRC